MGQLFDLLRKVKNLRSFSEESAFNQRLDRYMRVREFVFSKVSAFHQSLQSWEASSFADRVYYQVI